MPEIKKNFNNKIGTTAAIKLYLNSDCCDYFFNVFIGFYHLSYKKIIAFRDWSSRGYHHLCHNLQKALNKKKTFQNRSLKTLRKTGKYKLQFNQTTSCCNIFSILTHLC